MSEAFDPYHKWLGISPKDQPPNHYRLLAIELFESDADVIEGAADQRMAHVRTFQTGQNSALSQRILNELSTAKLCLLDPVKKAEYDRQLQAKLLTAASAPVAMRPQAAPRPIPVPAPLPMPAIVDPPAPASVLSTRPRRSKPAWQHPAILACVGTAVLLVGCAAYFLSVGAKPAVQAIRTDSSGATDKTRTPHAAPQPKLKANVAISPANLEIEPNPPRESPAQVDAEKHEPTPPGGESSPAPVPAVAEKAIDVLQQIDLKRDAQWGEWRLENSVLFAPATANSRLQSPIVPPEEYQLTLVAQGEPITRDIVMALPIAGRQALLALDGWSGTPSALIQLIDGKAEANNETTVNHRVLADGETEIVCTVRKTSIDVKCNGKQVIHWSGDPARLVNDRDVPSAKHLYLYSWSTPYRVSKFEIAPLAAEPETPPAAGLLKLFEDEPEFVAALTAGDGTIELASSEKYTGDASAKVSGRQRYFEHLPGVEVNIRKEPKAPNEYRFLRFAWKKRGGEQIFLQLFYPSNWLRYSAGPYEGEGLGPSIRIADELPSEWTLVTRDLAADFGEFTTSGIALSPIDGECGWFDHIYLARTLKDFDHITAKAAASADAEHRPRNLGDLVSGKQPPPDEAAQKKSREEIQKSFSDELTAAKTPAAKRKIAQRLIEQAAKRPDDAAARYVLLRQAADLAGEAGDVDLAWQAVDGLAGEFAVDGLWLKHESLAAAGKGAKSPEELRELAERDCELLAASLAARDAAAAKKIALQAQGFAKRTKDAATVKEIGNRTRDAGRLAAELDEAAAARKTLETSPDDAKANLAAGQSAARFQGNWSTALPMIAKGASSAWQKAAADELALAEATPKPQESAALADAWWAVAEKERWPARHYVRLHAAEWYRRALPSLAGAAREQPQLRLVEMLAAADGLPIWEILEMRGSQPFGDFVRLPPGASLRTPVEYSGPIEVSFVARTDGTNIRLWSYDRETVVWNWEENPNELRIAEPTGGPFGAPVERLEPNRWYSLVYRATRQGTSIFVDGEAVYRGAKINSRFPSSVVGVNGAAGSTVDVKKFVVRPLE